MARCLNLNMKTNLKLIAFGDSGIFEWADIDGGGWVKGLRRHWVLEKWHQSSTTLV